MCDKGCLALQDTADADVVVVAAAALGHTAVQAAGGGWLGSGAIAACMD
jgi:hypothetical protein